MVNSARFLKKSPSPSLNRMITTSTRAGHANAPTRAAVAAIRSVTELMTLPTADRCTLSRQPYAGHHPWAPAKSMGEAVTCLFVVE